MEFKKSSFLRQNFPYLPAKFKDFFKPIISHPTMLSLIATAACTQKMIFGASNVMSTPLILDAPNQNNRLAFPFVGRTYGRRLADFLLRQTTNKRDGETDPSG